MGGAEFGSRAWVGHAVEPHPRLWRPQPRLERQRARLQAAGVSPAVAQGVETARREKSADDALETLAKHGGRAIAWHDPAYPAQLREIPDPPPLLYVKGDLACADYQRTVAVVGTRRINGLRQTGHRPTGRNSRPRWHLRRQRHGRRH